LLNVPLPHDRPRPARLAPAWRLLLHALILAHLVAISIWSFTEPISTTASVQKVRARISKYLYPTGLWQRWNMFAPDPPTHNVYVEAEVTLRDGRRVTWPFPRMRRLGIGQRALKERYRKWGQERVWQDSHPDPTVATDAARFAARQVTGPENPPRTVELVAYLSEIPRPTPEQYARPWPAEPTNWTRFPFFTCDFDDGGRATVRPQTHPSSQPTTAPSSQPATTRTADATGGPQP
jgi:hypothetical protein